MSKTRKVLRARRHVGGVVAGQAVVSTDPFSARYDLDRTTGLVTLKSHVLYGRSIAGSILVAPTAKGGVGTAWALADMKERGAAPKGLVFRLANPIMVQGAALADIPIFDRITGDPIRQIRTGDRLRLNGRTGSIERLSNQTELTRVRA